MPTQTAAEEAPDQKLPIKETPTPTKPVEKLARVEFLGSADIHFGGLTWGPNFPGNMDRRFHNTEEVRRYESATLGSLKLVHSRHPDANKPAFRVTLP